MAVARSKSLAAWAALLGGVMLLVVTNTSCQWIAGFTLDATGPDAGSTATSRCAALPRKKSAPGGSMLLVDVHTGQTAAPCYWIDETEAPVREYAAWLGGDAGPWSAECSFKPGDGGSASNPMADTNDVCARSIPASEGAPFDVDKPMRCVDWCDAQAFCLANGKRLCEGNANFSGAVQRTRGDEWGHACSPSQATIYPWGDELAPQRCNVDQPSRGCSGAAVGDLACGPISTTAFDECRADGGAHELVGNVAEWTVTCAADADAGTVTAAQDRCQLRGGSYLSTPDRAQCASRDSATRDHRDPQTGFRCCADLTPDEVAQLPP